MRTTPLLIATVASRLKQRLGLDPDPQAPLDLDPGEYRDTLTTGFPIGPNTLAHQVRQEMLALQDEFDIRFPIVEDREPTLRSNPLRVDDMYPQMRDAMIERRRVLADHVTGMMHIYSNAGTGWLLWKRVSQELTLGASIDWLVQSHKLQQPGYRQEGDPVARRRLLAALGYAWLDAGTLLMDQPIREHGYAGVPHELAKIVMTAGHFDWGDLENGVHAIGHATVHVGDDHLDAGAPHQDQAVAEAIQHRANTLVPQFDPANWAYWRDDPAPAGAVFADRPERKAVVPQAYEAVHGAGVDIEPIHAAVDQPHVLVIQRVADDWVARLRREAVAHVDARIRADDNSIAAEWANMCEQFGVDDPIQRWEAHRRDHLDPQLPAEARLDA